MAVITDIGNNEYCIRRTKYSNKGIFVMILRTGEIRTTNYFDSQPLPQWVIKALKHKKYNPEK